MPYIFFYKYRVYKETFFAVSLYCASMPAYMTADTAIVKKVFTIMLSLSLVVKKENKINFTTSINIKVKGQLDS